MTAKEKAAGMFAPPATAATKAQSTASVPTAQIGNYATADELALALRVLRRPLRDREREFFPHVGGALLIDDGGGMPVECYDDATAVHYFLRWLDDSREQRAARFEVERRRASIKLVGGEHDGH